MVIEVGHFARLKKSIMVADTGEVAAKKGQVVYVAGSTQTPVTNADPYLSRLLFVCAFVKDGEVITEDNPFLCNGLNLRRITGEGEKRLTENFENKFGAE